MEREECAIVPKAVTGAGNWAGKTLDLLKHVRFREHTCDKPMLLAYQDLGKVLWFR